MNQPTRNDEGHDFDQSLKISWHEMIIIDNNFILHAHRTIIPLLAPELLSQGSRNIAKDLISDPMSIAATPMQA